VDNYDMPIELTEIHPIEEALRILEFNERSEFGLPTRHWGEIEVTAGPWIGCWQLIISINLHSKRSIYIPQERCVGLNMKPIDILTIIYNACDLLFRKEEPPKELLWGKIHFERYWEKRRQEEEKRPKLWADREFLRFCLSYITQYNDWSEEDYDVDFTYSDGQLKIKAREMEVCCPARGSFNGTLTFSARQLYRNLPKRFIDSTVHIIVRSNERAMIAGYMLPAKWTEKQILLQPDEP
jgi:hypothetical protein